MHCWWPQGHLTAQHPSHISCQQREPDHPLSPSGFCGSISFFLLGFPTPKHEAEGKKLWENAKKLFGKPTVTICTSSSADSNLPVWVALHHSHASGLGRLDLLTPSLMAVRLQEEAVVNTHVPSSMVTRNSELNQKFPVPSNEKDTPRQKGTDREVQWRGRARQWKPRTARDAGGRQSKAGRPEAGLAETLSQVCLQELTENPNELLILSPFSSWTFCFFQTYGGWGPNGIKKAPKCSDR